MLRARVVSAARQDDARLPRSVVANISMSQAYARAQLLKDADADTAVRCVASRTHVSRDRRALLCYAARLRE